MHMFGGAVTPFNVYDIEYRIWRALAVSVDKEIEEQAALKAEMNRRK